MKPPCEPMVKKFLPPIRGLVAWELDKAGFDQSGIASTLGVTQASVSYYLTKERSHYLQKLLAFNMGESEIEEMVSNLAEACKVGDVAATELLYSYWKSIASSAKACPVHRSMSGGLAECELCPRTMSAGGQQEDRLKALSAVRDAVALLEASPAFSRYVPEVYSNLVYCVENPESERDVVGVPGRLVKVKGRVKALLPPEFGASHHMARILLKTRSANPWVRSALNTGYDRHYISALQAMRGVAVYRSGGADNEEELLSYFGATRMEKPVSAVVYPGSKGLESVVYLFGENPSRVCEVAVSASTIASISH